jgi:hypothetical protein
MAAVVIALIVETVHLNRENGATLPEVKVPVVVTVSPTVSPATHVTRASPTPPKGLGCVCGHDHQPDRN